MKTLVVNTSVGVGPDVLRCFKVYVELMEVRQEIDEVKALLCRRLELDCLEELTGAEKPEGLLESPEDDASVLLTQSDSEIEVKPDIPVDVGYGEDSDNWMELGGSMEFGDASLASGNVEPTRSTCSSRARCPREYLEAVIHSPRLSSDGGYYLHRVHVYYALCLILDS